MAVDRKVRRLAIGRGLDDNLANDPSHEIDPDLASESGGAKVGHGSGGIMLPRAE